MGFSINWVSQNARLIKETITKMDGDRGYPHDLGNPHMYIYIYIHIHISIYHI